jgi:hypothetical protein
MSNIGWVDPVESEILLVFRLRGQTEEIKFSGAVAVLGENKRSLTWLTRNELPLNNGVLDLSNAPTIAIGGKRKQQPQKAMDFLSRNPSFQGAILLYPGSGIWDLGEGMVFVTSL